MSPLLITADDVGQSQRHSHVDPRGATVPSVGRQLRRVSVSTRRAQARTTGNCRCPGEE